MTTYIITNDRYSEQPDEVTFHELVAMCHELGWDAELTIRGGTVYDSRGEVVAEML